MFMPYQPKKTEADFSFDIRFPFSKPAVFVKWVAVTGLITQKSKTREFVHCILQKMILRTVKKLQEENDLKKKQFHLYSVIGHL